MGEREFTILRGGGETTPKPKGRVRDASAGTPYGRLAAMIAGAFPPPKTLDERMRDEWQGLMGRLGYAAKRAGMPEGPRDFIK